MTIMQGFPPEPAARATLANWRTAPFASWAFHHVREIVPSANVAHDPDDIWQLPAGQVDLGGVDIDAAMTATCADAVVIIHDGRLLFESYRNGMGPCDPHILMSVSKSVLGLVAGTLVERGELAEADAVTSHVPELAGTAYEGATVRDLLDMRVGVRFDEDYLATSGPIIDYRYAANWNPVPEGRAAGDLRSFMSCLTETDGGHGERFHYVSPNTDLLAWVFERASGMRFADLLSERLWKPMGAEVPGYITVDRIGGARAAGGFCVTARDLARIGAMVADGGRARGRQVIPELWIRDIFESGDVEAWRTGDFYDKFGRRDMAYRSKWYIQRGAEPMVHGLGIHGQYVFADPARQLSVAWFSSRHEPIEETTMSMVIDTVAAIRKAIG
ncbi:MAG: serine hydrolase [Pseudomonadota bacterium]